MALRPRKPEGSLGRAWFNIALRPRKPEGSTAQDGHLDSHTAPELCELEHTFISPIYSTPTKSNGLFVSMGLNNMDKQIIQRINVSHYLSIHKLGTIVYSAPCG